MASYDRIHSLARGLVSAGLLSDTDLMKAEMVAQNGGLRIDRAALELGLIDDESRARFLADWTDNPFSDALDPIDDQRVELDYLKRHQALQVQSDGDIRLALCDPLDADLIAAVRFALDAEIEPLVTTPKALKTAFDSLSSRDSTRDAPSDDLDLERLRSLADAGPIVRLVDEVFIEAIEHRASDVHFESTSHDLQVRIRCDGLLRDLRSIPAEHHAGVISRLKILAGLNIAEKRRPQDGRIRFPVRGRSVDLRMASVPTQHGESLVFRVLDRARLKLTWSDLGIASDLYQRIENLTAKPNGIFLVTGPTGSGKTTTLYTALSRLDVAGKKVITIEDPIEYELAGINQIQVQPDIGLTFAAALRAVLRQDPDIVMVGEIRDPETAENAVRAALMGRLVLSTLHTNSASGAIDRLLDLGVPPFLLGTTLNGVLSQRLVRRLCADCCGGHAIPEMENHTGSPSCRRCGGLGYSGRTVVAELLEITPVLGDMIAGGARSRDIEEAALRAGMRPMRKHGAELVLSGLTTRSEVYQAIGWLDD